MITSLTTSFNYEESMVGIVMGETPVDGPVESLKVRIPVYMPNIPEGDPKVHSMAINPMSIYKNDVSCRPALTSNIIKEQNYMTAKIYPSEDIEEIMSVEEAKNEDEEDYKYIKDGERLSIAFSNGKMSKIYFETTIFK